MVPDVSSDVPLVDAGVEPALVASSPAVPLQAGRPSCRRATVWSGARRPHLGAVFMSVVILPWWPVDPLVAEVRDDGLGFVVQAPTAGFGLLALRERVWGAGGELIVTSTPRRGARVLVSLPHRSVAPLQARDR